MGIRLSFKPLVDRQLRKCRQTYSIMKHIHRQVPSYMATIYCLVSNILRERINSFYRRCLRIIYCLFECPTIDIHKKLRLPTLEEKFQKNLKNRLKNIEQFEQELITCYLMNKSIANTTCQHYVEKSCIQSLSRGRPSMRTIKFYQNSSTFFDRLLQFAHQHLRI